MTDCPFCGDEIHRFLEELEDGTEVYVTVCPTCYRVRSFLNKLIKSNLQRGGSMGGAL